MTSKPNHRDLKSALRSALTARADELGIDPETVWCPSSHAIAAWTDEGSLLRIDFNEWPAAELSR